MILQPPRSTRTDTLLPYATLFRSLDVADALVEQLGLDGELQVASFHPQYRFAGSSEDDIAHFTNRSPWPTLHLLREDNVTRAVEALPDPDAIVERNVATLEKLGHAGRPRLFHHAALPPAPLGRASPHTPSHHNGKT